MPDASVHFNRQHPKFEMDPNRRTPKPERTQMDAPQSECPLVTMVLPTHLLQRSGREALGTSSPPIKWWCLHNIKELVSMFRPKSHQSLHSFQDYGCAEM